MISLARVKEPWAGMVAAWGVAVVLGLLYLEAYAARPGDDGAPPAVWPAESRIQPDGRRPTVLIFLHPQCPCSRASLAELTYIVERCRTRVSVHAVLLASEAFDRWGPSGIEQDLVALPDLLVHQDRGGAEGRRFKVMTSGHVLAYDFRGLLVFSGGITAARGHNGDNYGRAALLDLILNREGGQSRSPVFGCPLTTPGSTVSKEPP